MNSNKALEMATAVANQLAADLKVIVKIDSRFQPVGTVSLSPYAWQKNLCDEDSYVPQINVCLTLDNNRCVRNGFFAKEGHGHNKAWAKKQIADLRVHAEDFFNERSKHGS